MNSLFCIATTVLFLLGVAHSVFGEKLLLIPISKEKSVNLFKEKPYMINVMRFAWHITTIAWWGMAWVIFDFAKVENPLPLSVYGLAGAFAVTGLIILGYSRGLHPAWFFFLAIAGCLWAGL